LEFKKKTGL